MIDKDKLIQALREVLVNADEDTPSEYRTNHFKTAMREACEMLIEYDRDYPQDRPRGPFDDTV
jgi:hypothetical protein